MRAWPWCGELLDLEWWSSIVSIGVGNTRKGATELDVNGLYLVGERIGGGLWIDSMLIARSFSCPSHPTKLVWLVILPVASAAERGPETGSASRLLKASSFGPNILI